MSGRQVIRVAVRDLMPDEAQVRSEFDSEGLEGLATSLKERQLQPILAYRRDDKLVILDGERRWRASQLAGLEALDVLVVDDPQERSVILLQQLIISVQREDLAPMERAHAIERLMAETGWKQSQVAAHLGISAASVTRSLGLLKLAPEIQQQVNTGTIPATTAYEIARQGDHDTQRALADEVVEKRPSRDQSGEREPSGSPPSARGKVPRAVAKLGDGRTIAVSGPGLESLDDLIAWLDELLKRAKKARPRGVELKTFLDLLRDEAKAGGSA